MIRIGVDFGGTKIEAAALGPEGAIIARLRTPNPGDYRPALAAGADYVLIGRAAVLHHDYPQHVQADPDFAPAALPVSRAHLAAEGLSPTFITYMNNWPGFVAQDQTEDAL